jgi:hypothetical protein
VSQAISAWLISFALMSSVSCGGLQDSPQFTVHYSPHAVALTASFSLTRYSAPKPNHRCWLQPASVAERLRTEWDGRGTSANQRSFDSISTGEQQ